MQQAQSELAVRWHYEAIERRRRMAAVQPRPKEKPAVRSVIIKARRPHLLDATLYVTPIGPIRIRDFLFVSTPSVVAVSSSLITCRDIVKIVARVHDIPPHILLSHRRSAVIVRPRQEGMWLCKKYTSRSLPEIGRAWNGRDHTTVLHAYRKIEAMVSACDYVPKAEPAVRQKLEEAMARAEQAASDEGREG